MTLESQVCSLPLAQRLKELGVKQESYFYWKKFPEGKFVEAHIGVECRYQCDASDILNGASAFTVAEAEIALPATVNISYKNGKPRDSNHCLVYSRVPNGYRVAYVNRRYDSDSYIDMRGATLADALCAMRINLLEKGLITAA